MVFFFFLLESHCCIFNGANLLNKYVLLDLNFALFFFSGKAVLFQNLLLASLFIILTLNLDKRRSY